MCGITGQDEEMIVHGPRDTSESGLPFRIVRVLRLPKNAVGENFADEVEEFITVLDPPIERAVADAEGRRQLSHGQRVEIRCRRGRFDDPVTTYLCRASELALLARRTGHGP